MVTARSGVPDVGALRALGGMRGVVEHGPTGGWETTAGHGVVLSAPHEVDHVRDGAEKRAERGTGRLAFALARAVGAAGIRTHGPQAADPNWDTGHPYTARLARLSPDAPVVDLHMMRDRGVEVCVGLGPVPDLADGLWQPLVEEAVAAGLRTAVNWPFPARKRTVTAALQRAGRRAVQVELTWDCYDPTHPSMPLAYLALLRAVQRIAAAEHGPR
ncbi:N-formylglutamate amidohydrolase [Pseudonocardia thermophila]|uniref:N-formylglutamate amidohydrolase n=1 Tax=Pseudonocardia thermophila TaxID=1848 RepID=UPI001160F017|nr:N-formylglutamate amidohydrolase [Pseudonocardia thermophila]